MTPVLDPSRSTDAPRYRLSSTALLLLALPWIAAPSCTEKGVDPCADPLAPASTCDLNRDRQIDGFAAESGDDGFESINVRMCMTGDGRLYAGWIDDREGYADVWFNRSVDGGDTWLEQPIRVKQGPASDAANMELSCVGDRVYVVWEDNRDGDTGYENIYLNYSADQGDTWQTDDIALDNDPDGLAISLEPKIALYRGKIHVVWYDQVAGSPDIYMATSTDAGQTFGEPVRISGGAGSEGAGEAWSGKPLLEVDRDGRLYVVWEDTRNGKLDLFFSSSSDGGVTFSGQRRIDTGDERGANNSFEPSLAADDGHVYVVWHDERSGEARDVLMNYSPDGGDRWLSDAVRVASDQAGLDDKRNANVSVSEGTAYVVWEDSRNGGFDIYYRAVNAGRFDQGEESRVDTDIAGSGNSLHPRILDADGTLVVAWEDRRDGGTANYNDLYYNYLESEATDWGRADMRLDSVVRGTSYAVDLNITAREGWLYSTWADGRTGSSSVYFSRTPIGQGVDEYTVD